MQCGRRTLQDGEQDDDDEEEEGDVEDDAVHLRVVSVGRLQLVADPSARSHSLVQVEHEALEHHMCLVSHCRGVYDVDARVGPKSALGYFRLVISR